MLSWSAEILESSVNLKMVVGDDSSPGGDVEHARELMNFAEAIASRNELALETSRSALLDDAGPAVMVDAAAVAANFQRMVRIADSTGIPLDERNVDISAGIREELGLGRFRSAENTPGAAG
jgi:hypothetical protein